MKKYIKLFLILFIGITPLITNGATLNCYYRPDTKNTVCDLITPLPNNCQLASDAAPKIGGIQSMNCTGTPDGYTKSSSLGGGSTSGVYTSTTNSGNPNPGKVPAQSQIGYTPLEPLPGISSDANSVDFPAFLSGLIKLLIALGSIFAVLMFVFSGIVYMTSSVARDKVRSKERVQAALLGLLLLICSILILHEINPDILNFNLQSLVNLKQ